MSQYIFTVFTPNLTAFLPFRATLKTRGRIEKQNLVTYLKDKHILTYIWSFHFLKAFK